jgi:hypothetical protein
MNKMAFRSVGAALLFLFVCPMADAKDKKDRLAELQQGWGVQIPKGAKTFAIEPHFGTGNTPIIGGLGKSEKAFINEARKYADKFGAKQVMVDFGEHHYAAVAGACVVPVGLYVGKGKFPSWTPVDPAQVLLVHQVGEKYVARPISRINAKELGLKVRKAGKEQYDVASTWTLVRGGKSMGHLPRLYDVSSKR